MAVDVERPRQIRTLPGPRSDCLPPLLRLAWSGSLTEIEAAVKELSREELAKLAAFIARQDKLVWDEELEQDFSPGGKHAAALEKIDAEIGAGNFRPMP